MPDSFTSAVVVPEVTHDTIDDLFITQEQLRKLAHLLLDQRDRARRVAVQLEQELHAAVPA